MDTQILSNEKLEFLDILKESLSIPRRQINFIIFTLLTSIPYFFLSVFFENFLQKTLLDTFNFISPRITRTDMYMSFDGVWDSPRTFHVAKRISSGDLCDEWIKLLLLYLVPCYLVGLINIIMTVNAASTAYSATVADSEHNLTRVRSCAAEKSIGFKDLTRRKTGLKGPFVTSIYVLLLSTCILLGLVGVFTNWLILSKGFASNYYYYVETEYPVTESLINIFHVAVFMALLIKYSEWSAGWNMALVISILEETYGFDAFEMSAYFGRGSNTRRGLRLMLVFVVWEVVLRLPCVFGKCSERVWGMSFIYGSTSLICIGNLMKWVVCVVYFLDCKKRILEKKVDEEVGRKDVGVVDV